MARQGKIARLPFAVRDQLCEKLSDGIPAREVCAWVNALPAWKEARAKYGYGADISEQNVSDWRSGGFVDWQAERAKVQHLRAVAESACHIAAATGGDPAAVGSRILAGRLTELLESLDDQQAPELARALAALRRGENDAQRLELDRSRAELQRQALELERERFRRQTCEMFLKWHEDQRATAIADGPGANAEKISALLAYMDEQEDVP